jgi:hypothetical protein
MRQRCTNPSHPRYPDWGGRGVKVSLRWEKFESFLADMGERPSGTTIDRKDNNGNYEPGNCHWASGREQANNTRRNVRFPYRGGHATISEIARTEGLNRRYLAKLVRTKDRSVEDAIDHMRKMAHL